MKRTSFEYAEQAHAMAIDLVFESSKWPGMHSLQGAAGEHVFEILQRWLARQNAGQSYNVCQSGLSTWIAISPAGEVVDFTVIV